MRTVRFFSIVYGMLLSGCVATSRSATRLDSYDSSRFTYARIYCTPNRETHFENVTVELSKMAFAPPATPVYIGGNRPASGAFFMGADAHWGAQDLENHLNHPTPAPQFVTVLAGVFSVTTTDGETRQFRPGDVAWLDDTSPCKGHIAVAGDKPAFLMIDRPVSAQFAQATPSTTTSVNEKDAIYRVLSGYYDAFGRNSAAAAAFYGEPTLIVLPNEVIMLGTRADVEVFFDKFVASLKSSGYSHSKLGDYRVKLLNSTTALFSTVAIRMKADGTEMQRSGFTYLLHKNNAGWRIYEIVATDLDKLISAD